MLVRDGSGASGQDDVAGVEVFMLRRVSAMEFAPDIGSSPAAAWTRATTPTTCRGPVRAAGSGPR